ncbi:hypothetical protein [Sinosporangium album]|uniref:hypothetical protein n=1 Tax=Sinosporangium album TaxID=504805 RepID=UPI0030B8156A
MTGPDDEQFIVRTATTRPTKLGWPFTRWSIRKLLDYLHRLPAGRNGPSGPPPSTSSGRWASARPAGTG